MSRKPNAEPAGGGGGGGAFFPGGNGGSGIVIVSYATSAYGDGTGGVITHSGGQTIHTFTSDGTFTCVTTGGATAPNCPSPFCGLLY